MVYVGVYAWKKRRKVTFFWPWTHWTPFPHYHFTCKFNYLYLCCYMLFIVVNNRSTVNYKYSGYPNIWTVMKVQLGLPSLNAYTCALNWTTWWLSRHPFVLNCQRAKYTMGQVDFHCEFRDIVLKCDVSMETTESSVEKRNSLYICMEYEYLSISFVATGWKSISINFKCFCIITNDGM